MIQSEARASLAQAHRLERLDDSQHRDAVAELDTVVAGIDAVEVTAQLVRRGGTLADLLALRGYDAVHLASAELVDDPELVFAARDRRLRSAARQLHMSVADL
jgi:hypothetical protein